MKLSYMWIINTIFLVGTCCSEVKMSLTPGDLWKFKTISDPRLSPDDRWIAYTVATTDSDEDRRNTDIWIISAKGGESRQLTTSPGGDWSPCWSPDGKNLAFISSRDGNAQAWLLAIGGGEAQKITDFPGGISDIAWMPDGTALIFVGRIYPGCKDIECIKNQDEKKAKTKVTARVHEHLLFRHWNTYEDGKVGHLFIQSITGGKPRDLTPELKHDALNYWLGSAGLEYDIDSNGKFLYFAGNQDDNQALSTNSQIYRVPLLGGDIETLTTNPASDNLPRLSPDGKWLAYRAMRRPGYESDRYELMLMNLETGAIQSLTANFDRSVGILAWAADNKTIFFEAEDTGDINYFQVSVKTKDIKTIIGGNNTTGHGYHGNCQGASTGSFFVYLYRPIHHSDEIFRCDQQGKAVIQLTHLNQELYDAHYFPGSDEIWFNGDGGTNVHGFLLKPINFDSTKKYPMMVRIHGGPQEMFGNAFRYEYAIFTGAGYAVFFCNPRGSTGYGQQFTDAIRGDWGGAVVRDLKAGVRHITDNYSFIDASKVGAWGCSFGAFICNWIQGHNQDKQFAVLVSHAGAADRWCAYGTTEELWFPEWEMFGPPWENPQLMDELSPIRYAKNFHTPHLLSHGELDYRVRVTGSETMFTALQRLVVPSRMIRFPDENHWISKPHNLRFWYQSILDWFDQWLKN